MFNCFRFMIRSIAQELYIVKRKTVNCFTQYAQNCAIMILVERDTKSQAAKEENEMTAYTKRQWPKNLIMPGTARAKMEYLYYGVAELKLKERKEAGASQRDALFFVIGYIKEAMRTRSPKHMEKNDPVYQLVLQNDIGVMAEKIYNGG